MGSYCVVVEIWCWAAVDDGLVDTDKFEERSFYKMLCHTSV